MGADSTHLSWILLRLTRDASARAAVRRLAGQVLSTSMRTLHAPSSPLPSAQEASRAAVLETWSSRISRRLQERRGRRLALIGNSQSDATPSSAQTRAAEPCIRPITTDDVAASSAATGGGGVRGRSTVYIRRRRWSMWRPPTSWEFPTLNASFPFTIPAIPANLFLFGQHSAHGSVPSGVIMPAGLGTSARKFHSMSLNRQPGVPFEGDEDGTPPLTDTAALSAQLLQSDATSAFVQLQRHGKAVPQPSRRSDGAANAQRLRTPKNYMFAHAATGIPKFENRIPLAKRAVAVAAKGGDKSDQSGSAKSATAIDLPEEEMATSAGEDAFFHRTDALGIADGVGGWAGVKDADPSLFARRLMHHVSLEIQRYEDIDDEMFSHYYDAAPVDILRRAYEFTLGEMEALAMRGSSTACVVVLRGDELRVANLGDCGLTVVRQGDMVYRTEEQQHSFNYPYQLGTEAHSDRPSDAQVFRLKIQKGDVIIVGSDGVFDNLFDEDILEEVNQHLPPAMRAEGQPELKYSTDSLWYESQQSGERLEAICRNSGPDKMVEVAPSSTTKVVAGAPKLSLPQFHVDPHAISLAIAKRAKLVSEDTRYTESPFQMRAMQEGLYYQGGKRDDITVVVAVVTDLEDSPDRR
ncbi:hypothetical protein GGI03_001558 [Coemansia sp. RSA 2337]|nr:hypothetical protein GGI14_001653 [Coemansia sp. S680]KAJ2038532.1 hypothetical protein H4S03_002286 [Coemansia sp. S3946]KAJ2106913.1 hypothetical protein IW146_007557 [Coemansia sp. RSA 922]KAJ2467454.1 hypothetical protein GGI03_001558 [Coemansia sp. RSA 2337]